MIVIYTFVHLSAKQVKESRRAGLDGLSQYREDLCLCHPLQGSVASCLCGACCFATCKCFSRSNERSPAAAAAAAASAAAKAEGWAETAYALCKARHQENSMLLAGETACVQRRRLRILENACQN